jgi:hypothetical protein
MREERSQAPMRLPRKLRMTARKLRPPHRKRPPRPSTPSRYETLPGGDSARDASATRSEDTARELAD